jgi:hypothetical protein
MYDDDRIPEGKLKTKHALSLFADISLALHGIYLTTRGCRVTCHECCLLARHRRVYVAWVRIMRVLMARIQVLPDDEQVVSYWDLK